MPYSNDWSDTIPIDHTKFNATPGAVRQLRVDIEQRLANILYGFASGETAAGIKVMPANVQASDPGATAEQVQIYAKDASSTAELFVQDEAGNVVQITSGGKINTAALSTTLPTAFVNAIFLATHEVGRIISNITGINPGVTYGGTWVAWGTGRTPVGVDAGQTEFATVEQTGGEKTHLLTGQESGVQDHAHGGTFNSHGPNNVGSNGNGQFGSTDGSGNINAVSAHNNLQPYITCYFWKRTA